jgi:AcrR family transcriptional regulator
MKATQKPKRAYRKSSETQKIIFDKAMAIMSEKGFQATTVREICAEANIPIGTFYNCYKSKVDILRVIYDFGDQYMQNALDAEPTGKSALEKLHDFVCHYATLNENTGIDAMRVLFYPSNEWFSHRRPMQTMVEEIVAEGQATGEICAEMRSGEIVDCIFDIIRGVCYDWCICGGSFDMSGRMETHFSLLCSALKTGQGA